MKTGAKTILLAFTLVSLVASPFAEAARMGRGKSTGMRRAAPTQSIAPSQQQAGMLPAPARQAQPNRGVGVGTAVAAGAAGAVAGYALGSMMNDGKTQQESPATKADANLPQHQTGWDQTPSSSGTPWGLIMVLAALFIVGLIWFRRKIAPPAPASANSMHQPIGMQQANRFEPIPKIGSGMTDYSSSSSAQDMSKTIVRLTDGTETPYFLRQAKATFLHLQSLNTPDSLEEVRKYMVADLVESLREDIARNDDVADFPTLDCQLLESVKEGDCHIASVRFSGMVSESVNAAAIPFAETWHYIKDNTTHNKWLVSGIQQD